MPIRVRVTLAFAGVMAVVLAGMCLFLYLRFETQLDHTLDHGLRSRAQEVQAVVSQSDSALQEGAASPLIEQDESFAQILHRDGRVLDATSGLPGRPLLAGDALRRAAESTTFAEGPNPFERDETARLLATPVDAQGTRLIVVVGAGLDDRDESLRNLALLLAIGAPIALLLASLAGYGVAAASLRPVEAMRAKAAAITEREPGERLPVPAGGDEIARLGTTLNALLARLESALARERALVADASHELRTPLAILKTELELALRQGRTPEELQAALRSAAEETDRLAQLAEDLLVIARFDERRLQLAPAQVRAADLLADVQRRFAGRAERAGRRLVAGAAADARLTADAARVEQALGNLVENALRHGAGDIELRAQSIDGRVHLGVHDEGPGFPPPFLGDAFERFTRADPARGRGGSGLGLAIVQAIARAHGGEAHAANDPSGGADVWLDLPVSLRPAP